MRKRLKKSDWRFWALLVLGLGTCVVMAWKLMPLSVGEFTFVILMTILGTAGYCWLTRRKVLDGRAQEAHQSRKAGASGRLFEILLAPIFLKGGEAMKWLKENWFWLRWTILAVLFYALTRLPWLNAR